MKRYALIIAVSMIAASPAPVHAQTNAEKIQNIEAGFSNVQNTIDSLGLVISDLQENLEAKAATIESHSQEISCLQDRKVGKSFTYFRSYSEVVMNWACLLIFAIYLPLLLVRLYNRKTKEEQRRYDIIVDLVRSGVDIKPEMREYLFGSSSTVKVTLLGGKWSGFSKSDIDYCSNRILWAICLLIIGFTIAMISKEGIVFAIFACIAAIFAVQAIVRCLSLKYFNERKAKEEQGNAQ